MARAALTLTLLAGLSLWASGQQRAAEFHQQLKQFEANQLLLNQLIDHGLNLSSRGGEPVARAEECRLAAVTLAAALKTAPADDPERVAELSDHITAIVRDGLVPNLAQATRDIPPGSQDYERLKGLSDLSKKDVAAFVASFPAGGKLDQSPTVIGAKSRLAEAGDQIIVVK